MKSLAEQLIDAGLVSDRAIGERRVAEMEEERKNRAKQKKAAPRGIASDLQHCRNVQQFRKAAKAALLNDRGAIDRVVARAHDFKNAPAGKKIVWQMFQVKKSLGKVNDDRLEQFLNRAFRRSKQKFDVDF